MLPYNLYIYIYILYIYPYWCRILFSNKMRLGYSHIIIFPECVGAWVMSTTIPKSDRGKHITLLLRS